MKEVTDWNERCGDQDLLDTGTETERPEEAAAGKGRCVTAPVMTGKRV